MEEIVPSECRPSKTSTDLAAKSEDHDLRPHEMIMIFLVCFLPCALVIGLLSDVGVGLKFYSALAPANRNLAGNAIIGLGSTVVCLFLIFDFIRWPRKAQGGCFVAIVYWICIGAFLKSRWYPQAPIVIILFHIPAGLGALRMVLIRKARRSGFYHCATACLFLVGFISLIVWLLWMNVDGIDGKNQWNDATKARLIVDSSDIYKEFKYTPGGDERSISYYYDCDKYTRTDNDPITGKAISNLEKADRGDACSRVKTIWFLVWMAPFICFGVTGIQALFCIINGSYLDPDTSRLEKVLKRFILMICVIVICGWCSASVGAASMRLSGVLMAFCGAGLLALVAWVFLRLGLTSIAEKAKASKSMKTFVDLARNDWSRACVVIGMNMMIPWALLINMLNQKVRKARGASPDHDGRFTKEVEPIVRSVLGWSWGSILVKANRLVQVYFTLSIGVAKATYVFLSWLNETLLEWDFPLVLITFFAIGLTMFMLPPVPGVPVYILSGILIAARARTTDVGYGGGIIIAVLLSFVLKLMAVAGQYSIGIMAGRSVAVQKFVGVDKVVIRAIESILKETGIKLPKVAVLVGGPDWPTSVLCGILRLNLCQCLLGTMPVIFVSSPCVLAGAFMTGPNPPSKDNAGEKGVWDTLASTMLGVSMVCQLASGVLALYFTQEVVYKCGDELAKPRPEHEPVAELTRKEAAMVECYAQVIAWKAIPTFMRICLLISTVILHMSFFIFMFMDESCFRPFQVSNRIGDDYDDYGLDGKPASIVLNMGKCALGLFALGCILDFIFSKWASMTAKSRMKEGFKPSASADTAGPTEASPPPAPPKEAW